MAGPSGAGAVQDYIRASRSASAGKRRDYLTALRREVAKHGRNPELADFDCFSWCVTCGHLSEPHRGDPMRSDDAYQPPRKCAECGALGLVDLRQTPMVESLLALERSDIQPRRGAWIGKILGVLGFAVACFGLFAIFGHTPLAEQLGAYDEIGYVRWPLPVMMLVGTLLSWLAIVRHVPGGSSSPRRTQPRRWRMPTTSKHPDARPHRRVRERAEATADLLHAPLSGRPCLAYEVAVRDDANPDGTLASWRLLEQDNVGFRVGELEVAPGEATLQLEREELTHSTVGAMEAGARRYMRMRGLLEGEAVYVYETVLVPGEQCEVSRRKANAPITVRR